MKVIILTIMLLLPLCSVCSANGLHDIQDNVGVDKFAHAGVSYIIADQCHRNLGMNKFWAAVTTLSIGAAKELWIDNQWDSGDFAADAAGVLFYEITF